MPRLYISSFGNEPIPDSLVINQAGLYNCAKVLPANPVECIQRQLGDLPPLSIDLGKKYRFRVVNAGTLAGFSLRSPGAQLKVIEVDGGSPLAGEAAQSVGILYPGERMDLLASWTAASAETSPFLEVDLDRKWFRYPSPILEGTQQFPIEFSGKERHDFSEPAISLLDHFSMTQLKSSEPLDPSVLPNVADLTIVIYATTMKLSILCNEPHGFMNQTTWHPQIDPALPLLALPRAQWEENQFVPFIEYNGSSPKWVDLVINNLDDSPHSFHGHGLSFYVLNTCVDGTSWGSFNPFDARNGPPCGPYNLVDPVLKGTVFVPKRGYAVLRFLADNPGTWMFHCHMMWHQVSGMAMGFEIGKDVDRPLFSEWDEARKAKVKSFCRYQG